MRWPERRLAMLEAMGVRLWLPPGDATPAPPAAAPTRAPQTESITARAAGEDAGGGADVSAAPAAFAGGAVAERATPDLAPALDWPALRAAVAGCTACALHRGRRQTVFGVGNERAHWMVVGEAPGAEEDRLGEPFVGKSGQLLDNMLRSIGLSRSAAAPLQQVYIANTVKCRPPGNRNPEPDELARCEPYLLRQIELVRPRVIIAMGRFAVQSLLRSDVPVGRLRGRVHRFHGVPLIVTYHPAYLLRQPGDKARAWEDLCLALETGRLATGP